MGPGRLNLAATGDPSEPTQAEMIAMHARVLARQDGIGEAIKALRQAQLDLARAWRDEGRPMEGWII